MCESTTTTTTTSVVIQLDEKVHARAEERRGTVDAAKHRQEKRDNETGKVVIAHGSIEFCEASPIGLVDEPKESCTGARRTETCVAPMHVDASRVFLFYSNNININNEQRGGRGGR